MWSGILARVTNPKVDPYDAGKGRNMCRCRERGGWRGRMEHTITGLTGAKPHRRTITHLNTGENGHFASTRVTNTAQ